MALAEAVTEALDVADAEAVLNATTDAVEAAVALPDTFRADTLSAAVVDAAETVALMLTSVAVVADAVAVDVADTAAEDCLVAPATAETVADAETLALASTTTAARSSASAADARGEKPSIY